MQKYNPIPPELRALAQFLRKEELSLEDAMAQGLPFRLLQHFACDCAHRALEMIRQLHLEADPRSWEALALKRRWLEGDATTMELEEARVMAREAFINVARRVRANSTHMRAAAARALGATLNAVDCQSTYPHAHHAALETTLQTRETAALVELNLSKYTATSERLKQVQDEEKRWQTIHLACALEDHSLHRNQLLQLLHARHLQLDTHLTQTVHAWEQILFERD